MYLNIYVMHAVFEERLLIDFVVSKIFDIKQSVVKKVESGELDLDEKLLNKFPKLYGCSVDYLQSERDLQAVEYDLSVTETKSIEE